MIRSAGGGISFAGLWAPSPGPHYRLRSISQEVNGCPRKNGTTLRTTRTVEVLAERGSCWIAGRFRPRYSPSHHGLPGLWLEVHSSTLLTPGQTSLQQSTYENTKDIHEVSMDIHKISSLQLGISRNTDKETKGIAETTADIVHKAREIIVSVIGRTPVVEALIVFPTGSCGPRNLGRTQPRAQRRIPG